MNIRDNLRVSRLSFGTSRLHRILNKKKRLNILESAAIKGVNHFDTAPLYGYGQSERDLGEIFRSEKEITIATK